MVISGGMSKASIRALSPFFRPVEKEIRDFASLSQRGSCIRNQLAIKTQKDEVKPAGLKNRERVASGPVKGL
jgi:hypothetical protein